MLMTMLVFIMCLVVPRRLVVECTVLVCPFLSLFVAMVVVCEWFYFLMSLVFACVYWSLLLCGTKEGFARFTLSILCHFYCIRNYKSGGRRSGGHSSQ